MFARQLSFFQAAIDISAAYNDQKSFHEFGGLCARRIAHCMSNILRAMVPKCTKRFVKLGLEGDCLKENAPYRSAATGVPIGRAHTDDLSKMTIKLITKFCSVAVAIAAIVFAQLGPGDWQPRTGLGWQTEHVLAYFVVTSIACLVWPRPFVVGPALMAASVLLEALQALTPDRHANFLAGLYGAGGALAAALLAELFIRVWRWRYPAEDSQDSRGASRCCFCRSIACAA